MQYMHAREIPVPNKREKRNTINNTRPIRGSIQEQSFFAVSSRIGNGWKFRGATAFATAESRQKAREEDAAIIGDGETDARRNAWLAS